MASYNPTPEIARILGAALGYVRSVSYTVTARWVFYRLLQDGTFSAKAGYKSLLGYLSKARKGFWGGWRPDTLGDDTRAAVVRGGGYDSGAEWLRALSHYSTCSLDRWKGQPNYVEIWFEAAAMSAQFAFHANPNIPLLAFHGDVSIPAKWDAADRLVNRWLEDRKPIYVLYYGDLDPKGLSIPESARKDIEDFAWRIVDESGQGDPDEFLDEFHFIRVGLDTDTVLRYGVPENPERPGTFQWEGLEDDAARELIRVADDYLDLEAFEKTEERAKGFTDKVRKHLLTLRL